MRKPDNLFNVMTLIVAFLCGSVEVARTQSITIAEATIQKSLSDADARMAASMQRRGRYRAPCDLKRRAKAGAAIGFVMGMIVVNRIASEYDSTAGVKGTLAAGGYGAAMGALVGLKTCR